MHLVGFYFITMHGPLNVKFKFKTSVPASSKTNYIHQLNPWRKIQGLLTLSIWHTYSYRSALRDYKSDPKKFRVS